MTHNSGQPRSGGGTPVNSPTNGPGKVANAPTGNKGNGYGYQTPSFPDGNTKGKGAKYSSGKRSSD